VVSVLLPLGFEYVQLVFASTSSYVSNPTTLQAKNFSEIDGIVTKKTVAGRTLLTIPFKGYMGLMNRINITLRVKPEGTLPTGKYIAEAWFAAGNKNANSLYDVAAGVANGPATTPVVTPDDESSDLDLNNNGKRPGQGPEAEGSGNRPELRQRHGALHREHGRSGRSLLRNLPRPRAGGCGIPLAGKPQLFHEAHGHPPDQPLPRRRGQVPDAGGDAGPRF
jgi:hypothetical protein